eukprot:s7_g20.t1
MSDSILGMRKVAKVMDLTADDGEGAEELVMDAIPPQFQMPGIPTKPETNDGTEMTSCPSLRRASFSSNKAGSISASFLRGQEAECCICCAELPSDTVCMLMQGFGKKRSCRHYLHHSCVKLLMQSTPAPYLCPLCRTEFVRAEPLPDVRLNSSAWFRAIDDDDSGALEKCEVIDALCATLPVDPEKLEAVKLWSQWDLEGSGRITREAFEHPRGMLQFVLYSLPSLKREVRSGTIPDIEQSRESWFRYWDEDNQRELEFQTFLRALARTLRIDGDCADMSLLRKVLIQLFKDFGLCEVNADCQTGAWSVAVVWGTVAELAQKLRGKGLQTDGRTDVQAGHMLADLIEHLAANKNKAEKEAEDLFSELLALDDAASKDDLRLAKAAAAAPPVQPARPMQAATPVQPAPAARQGGEGESLFAELLALDDAASKDRQEHKICVACVLDCSAAAAAPPVQPARPVQAATPVQPAPAARQGGEGESLFAELLALDDAASKDRQEHKICVACVLDCSAAAAAPPLQPARPVQAATPVQPAPAARQGGEGESLFAELLALDDAASKDRQEHKIRVACVLDCSDDYFDPASGAWDVDGLKDDLRLAKAAKASVSSRPPQAAQAAQAKAEVLFAELHAVDGLVSKEDYYDSATGAWDVEGLQDDLKLAQAAQASVNTFQDGSGLLAELRVFDDSLNKEDYFDEASGTWDMDGLQDDLRLAKERAREKLEAVHPNGVNGQAENGELLFQQLRNLSPKALQEDYMVDGTWDLEALKVDFELVSRMNPEELLRELQRFSPGAVKEDYFDEATLEWDMEGLQEDLQLSRAQHPQSVQGIESRPLTQKLFCERPDGFCDRLLDQLKQEFGPSRFLRLRERARLLQLPVAELKRELPRNAPVPLEKADLVETILAAASSSPSPPPSRTAAARGSESPQCGPAGLTHQEVQALPLAELQRRLRSVGVSYDHCLERRELEELLLSHRSPPTGSSTAQTATDLGPQRRCDRCYEQCSLH